MKIQNSKTKKGQSKPMKNTKICQENYLQRVQAVNTLIKSIKQIEVDQILEYFSWEQIQHSSFFLLQVLSQEKKCQRSVFFECLASFDTLISIFKGKIFVELRFSKKFYQNINFYFQALCLEIENTQSASLPKKTQFQLYTVLFFGVMLIYFSGKRLNSRFKKQPLKLMNKSFITSLLNLQSIVNVKNERTIGLIIAYLIKNISLKKYGREIEKFILVHFESISSLGTIYHFIYCLREIQLHQEIKIQTIHKYGLLENLLKFWKLTFHVTESVYVVDYLNVILKGNPGLRVHLWNDREIFDRLTDFQENSKLSVLHQGLFIEILNRILPQRYTTIEFDQKLLQAFAKCSENRYALKFLMNFADRCSIERLYGQLFPYLNSIGQRIGEEKVNVFLYRVEALKKIVKVLQQNGLYFVMKELNERLTKILRNENLQAVCQKSLKSLFQELQKLISIQPPYIC